MLQIANFFVAALGGVFLVSTHRRMSLTAAKAPLTAKVQPQGRP
jgi:hypothetical protein